MKKKPIAENTWYEWYDWPSDHIVQPAKSLPAMSGK